MVLQTYLLIGLIIGTVTSCEESTTNIDVTRIADQSGETVVKATIALIQESDIFPIDYLFLIRLAYVSSNFGLDSDTFIHGFDGGIWQIPEDVFQSTKNVTDFDYNTIETKFCIDWNTTTWRDLRKPMFSGLAAMLLLQEYLPIPTSIEKQGEFFHNHLNKSMNSSSFFVSKAKELHSGSNSVVLDMAFALDASGSITNPSYTIAKEFVAGVVSNLYISPAHVRVAAISFSDYAHEHISLNDTYAPKNMTKRIKDIPYASGWTNTSGALKLLASSVFTEAKGSRNHAPKIAFILTDGHPNIDVRDTQSAAERLRDKGVIVFAIGIGPYLSMDALRNLNISTLPKSIHVIKLEDVGMLIDLVAFITVIALNTQMDKLPTSKTNHTFMGEMNFKVRSNLAMKMSITARPDNGNVKLYGSFQTTKPNEAFADFVTQASTSKPSVIYLSNSSKPLYLAAVCDNNGEDSCNSTVVVDTEPANKLQKTGAHNLCVKDGNVIDCSEDDFVKSKDYETTQLPDEVTNVCQTSAPGYHAHPSTNLKYIYCGEAGMTYLVNCEAGFAYLDSAQDCVLPASTTPDQICSVCTENNYRIGLRRFPHPDSNQQYVQCTGQDACSVEQCTTKYMTGDQDCQSDSEFRKEQTNKFYGMWGQMFGGK